MKRPDPRLSQWAKQRRELRQETNTHEVFGHIDAATQEVLEGWGGLIARSEDNQTGARELELALRPVLLGLVEIRARLSSQGIEAKRPHGKSAYIFVTPTALRELAAQLLETADAADAMKLKPRPVD